MNPGPVEEAGKVAGGITEALKSVPLALSLVVMNIALLVVLFIVIKYAHDNRRLDREAEQELQQLLSHCVVPPSVK